MSNKDITKKNQKVRKIPTKQTKKHSENREKLPQEHPISGHGVKLFLLNEDTISIVTTYQFQVKFLRMNKDNFFCVKKHKFNLL